MRYLGCELRGSMKEAAATPRRDLWAITSYFNPMRYQRKITNFRVFREHLQVPLAAVELTNGAEFELQPGDADVLLQLRGGAVMWQKERLLNEALRALPNECDKVAWLDCDVIFGSLDWAERAASLLDRFKLVQPFSHMYRTPKEWQPGDGKPLRSELCSSPPFLMASGMSKATCLGSRSDEIKSAPGCAWVARRETLQEHQLYDACIIGGGDSAVLRATHGYFEDAARLQHMNSRQKQHYGVWAKRFYDDVGGLVTFLPGDLFHLWHGSPQNRRYGERVREFSLFEFDPFEDIAIDRDGSWRWNSDKSEMHEFVRGYFASRREDG